MNLPSLLGTDDHTILVRKRKTTKNLAGADFGRRLFYLIDLTIS